MDESSHNPPSPFPTGTGTDSRTAWTSISLSVLCHLLFFLLLVFVPELGAKKSFSGKVIQVSMVNLSDPGPTPAVISKPKPEAVPAPVVPEKVKPPPPKVKPVPIPKPVPKKEKTPLTTKPKKEYKPKKSLKAKTKKEKIELVRPREEPPEPKPEEPAKAPVEPVQSRADLKRKALEDLREKVSRSASRKQEVAGAGQGSGNGRGQFLEAMQIYQAEIMYRVQRNWAFPDQMVGGVKELEAWVAVEIRPDGEINKVWFDKKSGNRTLDTSAYNAVQKSNPLPPLPNIYKKRTYTLGFKFSSKGII